MVFRRTTAPGFCGTAVTTTAGEVGDGTGSSTVMAPVCGPRRTFPEAPPAMWRQLGNGQEEQSDDHDMLRLLERPNPFYTGPILWMATIADYKVNGNGYWIKEWNRAGTRPVRLWFTPSWMIEPMGSDTDQSVFIEYYELHRRRAAVQAFDPRDVVHFRFGLTRRTPAKASRSLKTVCARFTRTTRRAGSPLRC
jgi:hypothetical protein